MARRRLPIVLTPAEVRLVLRHVHGAGGLFRLMARLLDGCGLRVTECYRLRVHDLALSRGPILVRGGKGNKDRVVMLPHTVRPGLQPQLAARRALHERDQARGVARGLARRSGAQGSACSAGIRMAVRVRVTPVVALPADRVRAIQAPVPNPLPEMRPLAADESSRPEDDDL